ncbi:putative isxo2-like transposase domain protein [Trichonephila clavipes]|uniref:Putative isxo2-like transposase domain protein n=1 Tax=Trichonephila clavipes TaxID=2585209 RepID=A0A8X6RY85_TRICX|nr:putative isxo2-like transposase domain protein [Trichonephila clavipes]
MGLDCCRPPSESKLQSHSHWTRKSVSRLRIRLCIVPVALHRNHGKRSRLCTVVSPLSRYECPKCEKDMVLRERKGTIDGYEWRCRTKGGENPHDVCKSIRKEVCMVAVLKESEPLGGEGKIVEIDGSMFGKMKYGKGKPVNGQWVFGGVEMNSNKCFFRVVPNRTKEELLSVIKEWLVPGSVIISDCWKAYNCLSHEGYQHLRVNHSLTFKDPETGAHTNSIEGTWSAIKRSLRTMRRMWRANSTTV